MEKAGKHAPAIVGAVMAYIKLEEEEKVRRRSQRNPSHPDPWKMSARQDTMQLRRLSQLGFAKKERARRTYPRGY